MRLITGLLTIHLPSVLRDKAFESVNALSRAYTFSTSFLAHCPAKRNFVPADSMHGALFSKL